MVVDQEIAGCGDQQEPEEKAVRFKTSYSLPAT